MQALFNLPWNGPKGWDQNKVVGGFNEFGRRPSAIVQANGHERYGYFIEEAIWQYLERSCWHDHDPKSFKRIASARSLYHWNADANQEY